MNAIRGRGVYLHMPWCVSKCPYCDFNSHAAKGPIPEARYLDALLADLERDSQSWGSETVTTVFIGGGTPSLMSPNTIERVLSALDAHLTVAPDAEVTLEANPESLTDKRAAGYACAGVNRFSVGVQSFDNHQLGQLGRAHDASAARQAVRSAQKAGVANINVDLMYALPGQSVAAAEADVQQALELGITHLSHYQLTLEPNTVFHAQPPSDIPNEDAVAEIETRCRERIEAAGLVRYEVSAFSQPGCECRHNLNYWQFGDYLGLGAGAHGKVSRDGIQYRTRKPSSPRAYMACQGAGECWPIEPTDLVFEFMLNRLRLLKPISDKALTAGAGPGLAQARSTLNDLAQRGLMVHGRSGWEPTTKGRAFLNDILQQFLPESQGR